MQSANDKPTIISMAVLAIVVSSTLHEGVGHALLAWLRGDVPTELTSNHLTDLRPDRLVEAGGTLVNLGVGGIGVALLAAQRLKGSANLRYFLWLVAGFNLLDGAGYFLFSGILGLGDWSAVIHGLPHSVALRLGMSLGGAALYAFVVWMLARLVQPYCPDRTAHRPLYNVIGRLPYLAACVFYCFAGAFDPLGIKLLFLSTIPAVFGGLSGLMWADAFLPRKCVRAGDPLIVGRSPAWWVAASVIGLAYVLSFGQGIHLSH